MVQAVISVKFDILQYIYIYSYVGIQVEIHVNSYKYVQLCIRHPIVVFQRHRQQEMLTVETQVTQEDLALSTAIAVDATTGDTVDATTVDDTTVDVVGSVRSTVTLSSRAITPDPPTLVVVEPRVAPAEAARRAALMRYAAFVAACPATGARTASATSVTRTSAAAVCTLTSASVTSATQEVSVITTTAVCTLTSATPAAPVMSAVVAETRVVTSASERAGYTTITVS